MSAFSLDWLRAREPFDCAARDGACAQRFAAALRGTCAGTLRLLDLAAGTGSNFRALAPVIAGDQDWALVDHDPALLASQAGEIARWAAASGLRACRDGDAVVVDAPTGRWRASPRALDLAVALATLDLGAVDGITTCAFLDLVSAAWLDRLAGMLVSVRRPLLAALTVDGRRTWLPPLAGDAEVLAAFARHQSGDKGFGAALGPGAAPRLAAVLRARAFEVTLTRSDWRIGPGATDLLQALLDETVRAASAAQPTAAEGFAGWGAARRAQLAAGTLALEVGHLDLLALPRADASVHA